MAAMGSDAIEWIDLQDVRDDESWVTDPDKVDAFARHIKQGKMFSSLLLRRVWHEDASFHYEIIDGFHRYRALIRASVERHPATVVECDDRTADYDRVQASLDKPSIVLHKRAIRAIQQGFIRDVRERLGAHDLLERYIDENGSVHIRPRKITLSDDASEALMTIIEHEAASKLQDRRSRFDVIGDTTERDEHEAWRAWLNAWLDQMCSWFGVKRDWLVGDALALSVLDLAEGDKSQRQIWKQLQRIPDLDVRMRLIARIRHERPGYYVFEGAFQCLGLGVHPNELDPTYRMGKSAMLRLIASHTIEDLRQQYWQDAHARQVTQQREASSSSAPAVEDAPVRTQNDAVFAIVSPTFTGQESTPVHAQIDRATSGSAESEPSFDNHLIQACERLRRLSVGHILTVYDLEALHDLLDALGGDA